MKTALGSTLSLESAGDARVLSLSLSHPLSSPPFKKMGVGMEGCSLSKRAQIGMSPNRNADSSLPAIGEVSSLLQTGIRLGCSGGCCSAGPRAPIRHEALPGRFTAGCLQSSLS